MARLVIRALKEKNSLQTTLCSPFKPAVQSQASSYALAKDTKSKMQLENANFFLLLCDLRHHIT